MQGNDFIFIVTLINVSMGFAAAAHSKRTETTEDFF